jgi:hypothetical protein
MNKIYCIGIFALFFGKALAQSPDAKRDYQWVFGYPSSATDYGAIMDFGLSPSQLSIFPKKLNRNMSWCNSNVCTPDGRIAVFTNGCDIYNNTFSIVEQGADINYSETFYNLLCKPDNALKSSQMSLILPSSVNSTDYFVFYKKTLLYSVENDVLQFYNRLFLSKVSFQNNVNGKVTEREKVILSDSMTRGELSACRHANGKDWWVINWAFRNNADSTYLMLLLKGDTILGPYRHSIGKPIIEHRNLDQSVFSPDGKKYVRVRRFEGIHLYDFDRQKGELSNFRLIPLQDSILFSGVNFSANSRFLYVGKEKHLLQLDLEDEDILGNIDTVAIWDGFKILNFFPSTFFYCYLGPDCKMYVTHSGTMEYLTVVNYPNRKGKNCEVAQHALKVPGYINGALPNYPHFRLGAEGDNFPPCDSSINPLITGLGDDLLGSEGQRIAVAVYPNPAQSEVNVDLFGYTSDYNKGVWRLSNLSGKEILQYPTFPHHAEYRYDIASVPNGMYIWQLWLDGKPMRTGKLVVQRD